MLVQSNELLACHFVINRKRLEFTLQRRYKSYFKTILLKTIDNSTKSAGCRQFYTFISNFCLKNPNFYSNVFFFCVLQDVSQIQLGLSRPNEKRHSDLLNAMSARLTDAIYRDFLRKERRKMLLQILSPCLLS